MPTSPFIGKRGLGLAPHPGSDHPALPIQLFCFWQRRTGSELTPCAYLRRLAFCHGAHSRILRVYHQPYTMHAAYVAEKVGVGGNMERRLQD